MHFGGMDRGAKLREFVYLVTVEGGYEKYKENGAVYKTLYNSKKNPCHSTNTLSERNFKVEP